MIGKLPESLNCFLKYLTSWARLGTLGRLARLGLVLGFLGTPPLSVEHFLLA